MNQIASNEVVISTKRHIGYSLADMEDDADIFTLTGIKVGHGVADFDRLPARNIPYGWQKIAVMR